MGKQIDENFIRTYSDETFQHTAMVNHRGTVVAFAMDQKRKIYYTVLDIAKEDEKKGSLDVKYWMDNPRLLVFPNEIEQVGYGVITPSRLPDVKKGTRQEVDSSKVALNEIDPFLSTTARFSGDAPFQVFSDNQHIYVFRQSLEGSHADMVYKLASGGFSGTETDQSKYIKDSASQKVPIVHATLLVDRYILSATELKLPREVRFRRSENKTSPASAKDSLGAKDMEGNPFFEPTKELDFIRNLSGGCFSVVLLPTQVADIERWQIFAHNTSTKLIDSFNIERGDEGFFNTQGTQLFTSPDERYKTSVLERSPGSCPFTGLPLVPQMPNSGYAEWALQFDSSDAHVNLGRPTSLQITGDQTIEMWIKPAALGKRQNLFDKAYGGEGTITLEGDGAIHYYYGTNGGGGDPFQAFITTTLISAGSWVHIAVVRDLTNMKLHWYINGVPSGSETANFATATAGVNLAQIGWGYAGHFEGLIDEARIWNRARSANEIMETLNHRLVGDELGLAGYWRFDEGTGTKVKDQTSNGNHGNYGTYNYDSTKRWVTSDANWVASDAPIGDHPGMRRTSFAFSDRTVDTGLAAKLYYEQEKQSSADDSKSVKQNARVLLTAVTSGRDPNNNTKGNANAKKYVAAVDVGVSREGKLAQTPDIIPMPALLPSDSGGRSSAVVLGEIAGLEADIPRLETEIATLDTEIATLGSEISSLDSQVGTITALNQRIYQLQQSLKGYRNKRYVTFYQHSDQSGKNFTMETNETKAWVGDWWNDSISAISWDTGLKIECYRDINFKGTKWTFEIGKENSSWNDQISSIKVLETENLKSNRINTKSQLDTKKTELTVLENIRDKKLPPKRKQKSQKKVLLASKQGELNTKSAQLSVLLREKIGAPSPQPMQLFHTDPRGLTLTSGLLAFAYTDSQPHLFDSALGRMAMYFKGVNKQFFSAYYDVNTARARWSLAAATESLTLVSRTSESQVNDTAIVVANGSDADHCAVTLKNARTGLTETWTDVPREAGALARVLNGEAGEKSFMGKLKNGLSGTAATAIELKEGLPREAPAGSTLFVEDGSSRTKLTVSATAASGSRQITIDSTTDTVNAEAKVYLLLYDYAAKAAVNRPGYSLDNGNLHVNVVVGQAAGKVGNATASRIAEAQCAQWVADAPGSALYFDGNDDYLSGQDAGTFQHEGDISMEAWVRPAAFTREVQLIHCTSSDYSLGLKRQTLFSALALDGSDDHVSLPGAETIGITNHDFTVEAWVRIDAKAEETEQTILGSREAEGTSKRLHLVIREQKAWMGFFGDDLGDSTVLAKGTWNHIAFRYTAASKEQAILINGDPSSTRTATNHYQGTTPLLIGRWGQSHYLQGEIDELRIWNIARDATAIKADMPRRLGGQEPGLAAYYHFENRNVNDRSSNEHHGVLKGDLTTRDPVASPLSTYICFASVGKDAIQTTEAVASHSWHHFAAVYKQSYALKFDGNDSADAGNDSMLNITEDLTIEAFIKIDSLGRKQGILSKGIMDNGGEGSAPYAFYIDESGKLVLAFEDEDGKNYSYVSSSSLAAGAFKRVAVVRQIGREKVEKTGTTTVKYTEGGEEKTKQLSTIESIEFKEYSDIRFYIDNVDAGYHTHKDKKPIGNNGTLTIGQSYIAGQQRTQFQGVISEIRIWNVARAAGDVNSNLSGTEGGLTAWWRFEENAGNIAYDAKGGNHARLSGAQWVKSPDPKGSSFVIYRDGQEAHAKTGPLLSGLGADNQFTLGAAKSGSSYGQHYKGHLEEIRIWKTARRKEEILDNLFSRLKGETADLIASYSFDDINATEVKDAGLKSNHAQLPSSTSQQPTKVLSTAPISTDTAQVRSTLAGVKTRFHDQISGRPAVAEYADAQRLADGSIIGVYKRCYAYTKDGNWLLATGYKVGKLITEWIGQAQFEPQVIGYIEGAPPVPSENLTEGFYQIRQTFNGTSEVTLNESENIDYSISTSKESGFSSGFELEADLGMNFDPRIIMAPLGIGMSKKIKFKMQNTHKLSMEANASWSGGESFGSGQNESRNMSAGIGGNWDVPDKSKWANQELTRRFIPGNMGFAFVESETADIYALRLEHNGALVAFRMMPNPDIPKDTNIIPFPINNRYTKQGTLDGRIGYSNTGVVLDADYANATGYGEYSYFKPKEAYELKKRIEREEQKLKDFYDNFDTTPGGASVMGGLATGMGGGVGAGAVLGSAVAAKWGASVTAGAVAGPIISAAMIAGGMGATIGSLVDATATADEGLPEKYARRNIANTYVWTADGGVYEESTQISEVRSESKSGSYSFTGSTEGGFSLEVDSGVTSNFGLNGMLGGNLNLTKSKSAEADKSFSIDMKLLVPDNLQRYEYNKADDTSSGVKGVYDGSGSPVSQPGKVDAFRFMTFYLEPGLNNFEDLFGKVVDPIWLEESQHPNAAALREANQASKKPKCWRLFHRVTFVSRILPDFPSTTAPSLEKKMKDLNIASNYELVRRLGPFVRDHTANFIQFKDAAKAAVEAYLPELSGEADLNQITMFLADYYGVSYQ